LPKIGATVDTKCRTGPSTNYPIVSYLLVGKESVVLGTNSDRTWWLIEDPRKAGTKCWVWGGYTQPVGDITTVPVVEAQPAPAPSGPPAFQTEFVNVHVCGGVAMVVFRVGNTGPAPFMSSSILIKDVATEQGVAGPETSNNPFFDNPGGCPPGRDTLAPGIASFIAKGIGAPPPSGTKLRGIIVLCTAPNQSGQCVEMKSVFIYP
jgi:hypothetical protein